MTNEEYWLQNPLIVGNKYFVITDDGDDYTIMKEEFKEMQEEEHEGDIYHFAIFEVEQLEHKVCPGHKRAIFLTKLDAYMEIQSQLHATIEEQNKNIEVANNLIYSSIRNKIHARRKIRYNDNQIKKLKKREQE